MFPFPVQPSVTLGLFLLERLSNDVMIFLVMVFV